MFNNTAIQIFNKKRFSKTSPVRELKHRFDKIPAYRQAGFLVRFFDRSKK